MRKIMLPALVAVSLVASTAAFAADQTATGAITSLDAKACTVTLGKTVYQFAEKCDFSKLKTGEKVTITYTVANNKDVASKIVAA